MALSLTIMEEEMRNSMKEKSLSILSALERVEVFGGTKK